MSLKNDIKNGTIKTPMALYIEKVLNNLFYADQNIKEEIRFLQIKRGNDSQERTGLHASAIIASENDFCYREQLLSLFFKMDQGQNVSQYLKRIFMEGDCIHEKWQRLMIRGKLGIPEDMDRTQFNDSFDLSYTPDCLIDIKGVTYVVEIKSMNTFTYKKSDNHPSGSKQLKFYMYLTGIHDGFVLMEDKNTQEFKIQLVKFDLDEVIEYEERLRKIQAYKKKFLSDNKVPKRKCDNVKCKRAQKCNMKDACFNVGIGRIKI